MTLFPSVRSCIPQTLCHNCLDETTAMIIRCADQISVSVYGSASCLACNVGAYERWCGVDDAMMTWLGVPEVMDALHIQTDKKGTEKNNLKYQGGMSLHTTEKKSPSTPLARSRWTTALCRNGLRY